MSDAADQKPAGNAATPSKTNRPPGPLPLRLPILDHLKNKRVVLASASPRRKALLAQVGLTNLEIVPSTVPEDIDKSTHGPFEYVAATARQKCLSVYTSLLAPDASLASIPDPALVISADTIIATRDGRILEKPRSEADHVRMLRHLRDTVVHKVLTAVCVLAPREDARAPGYELSMHTEETKVYFAQEGDGLPDDVIEAYVKTREGADKAGGYAVQGIGGAILVEKVEGSVDNVIGLPVRKTLALAEQVIFKQDANDSEEEEADLLL
ncbi:putative acetylserotonin methytransferase-like protein [Plectosphaerella plurivora]|uniref:Acetylserotonin methytransferase-like protein n=1 Tax=Plectosphaerella plurivora TaxID=936078 RepID=A0A9P8VID8_9PEZI|nr:putative acetylserotonin methytransferase-like protein [Plectosphaerella plurivora]